MGFIHGGLFSVEKKNFSGYTLIMKKSECQKSSEDAKTGVIDLPRGGYLVDTPSGYVQFGIPPETIKDTMATEKGVPWIFVVMDKMFDWVKGISFAEIEFPIYFNFFIKKRKTLVICSEEQGGRIRNVLQESVFGPKKLDITVDVDPVSTAATVPDLRSEMNYFRNNLKLSDLVSIRYFKNGSVTIKDLEIRKERDGSFSVDHAGVRIARVPCDFTYKATYQIGKRLAEPYRPPLFSITCLGPSHGFDPKENTSGYIIWLNHHGIMVDPPVNSTEWLKDSNVNPKLIDGIILTHCHADHDAGTFQKILEERKITVYSTRTVMAGFLRKYGALSGVPDAHLLRLFEFHPVKIGKPVFIHGGKFEMFYTLHSIPTIGFKMEFQDQTFVYSSDHNNDPSLHKKLLDTGVITKARYDELRAFPWDSKVIYHESGVPPLHTPIAYLDSLPEEIKKRMVVYHIAAKDFPRETLLTKATFGIENTLVFKTSTPFYEKTYQILGVLNNLDFFDDLPLKKAQEFITIVEEERFRKGETIIRKGTRGDKFYIIYSGNVSVAGTDLELKKLYGTYEYFGEVAIVTGRTRTADVIAETDVIAYTISRDRFLNFIADTDFEKTLIRLARIRNSETWNLLSSGDFFRHLSSYQKTWLESILNPVSLEGRGTILAEGKPIQRVSILQSGTVKVMKGKKVEKVLKRGDFIGSIEGMQRNERSRFSYVDEGKTTLYAMEKEDLMRFIGKNPGILMRLAVD